MDRTENELRFELAKAALTGIISNGGHTPDEVARYAVQYADAVLNALDTPRRRGCQNCHKTWCQCEKCEKCGGWNAGCTCAEMYNTPNDQRED